MKKAGLEAVSNCGKKVLITHGVYTLCISLFQLLLGGNCEKLEGRRVIAVICMETGIL